MDIPKPLRPLVISELNPPLNLTHVVDGATLEKLKQWRDRVKEPVFGFDTETNVVNDFWWRRVRTIQLGDKNEQYVIDLLPFAGSEDKLHASQGEYGKTNGGIYAPIFDIISPMLCTNKFLKVGQNLSFEYSVMKWSFGLRIWNLYSMDMVERVIWAGAHSLKDYGFFSMAEIVARRFGFQIDKSLQQSFDLKTPATPDQLVYAALDTRMPLAVRQAQLQEITKDQLLATSQIENDAIGSYTDMHLNGQGLNSERWLKRIESVTARRVVELKILDEGFISFVGKKSERIDNAKIDKLEAIWKNNFEAATSKEVELAAAKRAEKDKEKKALIALQLNELLFQRKAKKAEARKKYSELAKQRTQDTKTLLKCEGEAFINYASNPQLLDALNSMPEMRWIDATGAKHKLEDTTDDSLLKLNDKPLIQTLRKYRKGKKETSTYGEQWTKRWTTKPCKEEGFLHPADGKLHAIFNQLEAETGRSSSGKPSVMNIPKEDEVRACFVCDPPDAEEPEGYDIVTVDMAGAELRIIAELANAKTWIDAFNAGQDVHSVGTEILYPEKWPLLACKGGEVWFNKEKNKEVILPPCAYFKLNPDGTASKSKCACPEHQDLRNGNKATNFLLCYGGGPSALADALGITIDAAKILYKLHESKFPDIWGYLKWSGEQAKANGEARDMYGRRRLFPPPTWDRAKQWIKDEWPEKLELDEEQCEQNVFKFKSENMREPNEEELFKLTHSSPDQGQIKWAMRALWGSIERQGKNHCIQGTNASIIKRAMGCGFDKDGKGYLWHLLPLFKARLLSMVHDELLIMCPKRFSKDVAACVADAFKRAAAEVMTKVIMEADFHIADRWMK